MINDEDEEAIHDSGEHLHSPEACKEAGCHLTSCDDDGYCNFCGEQEP